MPASGSRSRADTSTAARQDVGRQGAGRHLDARALTSSVAVVVGTALDARGEHVVADHVHANVVAGDVLLQLGRTGDDIVEAIGVARGEPRHDAAHRAHGFVDDGAVAMPELAGGVGVGRDQGGRGCEADCLNDRGLVGLGAIAGHRRRPVEHVRLGVLGPRPQRGLDCRAACRAGVAGLDHVRQLARIVLAQIDGADVIE